MPRRRYVEGYAGEATIEAYSVIVLHEGPYQASFSALTDAGERVWGRSYDRDLMAALLDDEDACGRRARLAHGLVELR